MNRAVRRASAAALLTITVCLAGCVTINRPASTPSQDAGTSSVDELNQQQIRDYIASSLTKSEDLVLKAAQNAFVNGSGHVPLHATCQNSSNNVAYQPDGKAAGTIIYKCLAVTEVRADGAEVGIGYTVELDSATSQAITTRD